MRKTPLSLLALVLFLCSACLPVLPRQRSMVALSGQARAACVAKPERCEALTPCSHEAHEAIVAWTNYSKAVAAGADETTDPLAMALITEGSARLTCAAQGVK